MCAPNKQLMHFLVNILTCKIVTTFYTPGNSLSTPSFRDVPNITFLECRKECMSRQKCKAFNYRRHFGLCLLLDTDSSSVGSDPDPRVVYSEKKDWVETSISTTCESSCGLREVCRLADNVTLCDIEECDNPIDIEGTVQLYGNSRRVGSKIVYKTACYNVITSAETDYVYVQGSCNENGDWLILNDTCPKDIFSYINSEGCFTDHEDRVLGGENFRNDSMTIPMCAEYCYARNYVYFGLQYTSECYCASTFTDRIPSSDCYMACRGDNSTVCGGPWALSVYTYN